MRPYSEINTSSGATGSLFARVYRATISTVWQAVRGTLFVKSAIVAIVFISTAGCAPDMADQPRYEALEASNFFDDGMASRPLVEGTIARGHLQLDDAFYLGRRGNEFVDELPVPLDRALLERGRQRYGIYCSHCHDQAGTGEGMVVVRGFPRPPSYHIDRLRDVPVGYLFDVISNGLGRMPEHGSLIPVEDRWAIAAYVRTLQLSQHAEVVVLSNEDLSHLQEAKP